MAFWVSFSVTVALGELFNVPTVQFALLEKEHHIGLFDIE